MAIKIKLRGKRPIKVVQNPRENTPEIIHTKIKINLIRKKLSKFFEKATKKFVEKITKKFF